jgi:CheY-like chemotaxis protein
MSDLLSNHVILAVDDEQDNLEVFKATLEMLYNSVVHVALGGPQALEQLDTLHPTVIVTDLSMPGMDGYALLHELRKRPDTIGIPIIAITAHAMAGDRDRILEAGFDGYVSKPFDVMILGEQIIACLDEFHIKAALKPHPSLVEVHNLNVNLLTDGETHAIQ